MLNFAFNFDPSKISPDKKNSLIKKQKQTFQYNANVQHSYYHKSEENEIKEIH